MALRPAFYITPTKSQTLDNDICYNIFIQGGHHILGIADKLYCLSRNETSDVLREYLTQKLGLEVKWNNYGFDGTCYEFTTPDEETLIAYKQSYFAGRLEVAMARIWNMDQLSFATDAAAIKEIQKKLEDNTGPIVRFRPNEDTVISKWVTFDEFVRLLEPDTTYYLPTNAMYTL